MLVNETRLNILREEIGEDGFAEVLSMFLAESDEVIARLSRESWTTPPQEELHFLKGVALNLGFDDLADLCRKGERGEGFDAAVLAGLYAATCRELGGMVPV